MTVLWPYCDCNLSMTISVANRYNQRVSRRRRQTELEHLCNYTDQNIIDSRFQLILCIPSLTILQQYHNHNLCSYADHCEIIELWKITVSLFFSLKGVPLNGNSYRLSLLILCFTLKMHLVRHGQLLIKETVWYFRLWLCDFTISHLAVNALARRVPYCTGSRIGFH